MVTESAIALITAACGLCAAIIAKMRCRFMVDKDGRSCAAGFSEFKLPTTRS